MLKQILTYYILILFLFSCTKEIPTNSDTEQNPLIGTWIFSPSDTQSLEYTFTDSDSLYIIMSIPGDVDSIGGVFSVSTDTINYLGYFSASEQFHLIHKYSIVQNSLALESCNSTTSDFMETVYQELLLHTPPPNQIIFNKQ